MGETVDPGLRASPPPLPTDSAESASAESPAALERKHCGVTLSTPGRNLSATERTQIARELFAQDQISAASSATVNAITDDVADDYLARRKQALADAP